MKNEKIILPGEVFFALATNRVELVGLLRNRIANGTPLSNEEMEGLLTLYEDTMKWRDELITVGKTVERLLEDQTTQIVGLGRRADRLRKELFALRTGQDPENMAGRTTGFDDDE